jgi:ubiquinone/menaquinone biosynthesis C-methylase UbiE
VSNVPVPPKAEALAGFVSGTPERFVPELMAGTALALEHLARYWWASALVSGRRVLDAGCGVGYGSAIFARAGAEEVVGVDLFGTAIDAAARYADPVLQFEIGDVRRLTFPDRHFDVVACFEVIEHVAEQDVVLDELSRVLRKDGVLVISSPNKETSGQLNPHHVRELTREALRSALLKRFTHVRLYSQVQCIASLILSERDTVSFSTEPIRGATLRNDTTPEPPEEPYTVALASNAPLRDLHPAGFVAFADLERETEMLAQIYRSLSWRLTRPLRAVHARISFRSRRGSSVRR